MRISAIIIRLPDCSKNMTAWFWPVVHRIREISMCRVVKQKVSILPLTSWRRQQRVFWIQILRTAISFLPKAKMCLLSAAVIQAMTVSAHLSVWGLRMSFSWKWCRRHRISVQRAIHGRNGRKSARQITARRKPLHYMVMILEFMRQRWNPLSPMIMVKSVLQN